MDTPSWHRVKEIIEAALARPAAERAAFVLRMCGDDTSLRTEVESLLAAIEQAGNFIEQPALQSMSLSAAFPAGWIPDLGRRALEPGNSVGPYTILEFVGAGGMGEVYRAHDSNLNRDVALKVRPAAFALDADRFARFRREAQMLASLNHPNIAAIYGLENSDGVQALVLELVEGPTLANRIAMGRDSGPRSVIDRETDCGRAGSSSQARHHSQRSEARQHQAPSRRHGEDPGLRVGEGS